jgi:ATP-dependent helicase/nuclease subunit A
VSGGGKVFPLQGSQRHAVEPDDSVWLSASAGTGKTQVLSARVLRLLLRPGVDPSQVLCLTFTKAGAAEMAVRINEVLARWVRLPDGELFNDLEAIGAPSGPEARAHARTLFASVLDCPGGGLRIDTIHAFSQWLLAAFPNEAGLAPGVRAMEDRDRDLLQREVLAELLLDAEARGDKELLDALAALSLRLGPEDVQKWLLRCGEAREAWFGPGSWVPPLRTRVNQLLGLAADADKSHVLELCGDDAFDALALRCCLDAYSQWNGKKGQEGRVVIADWLSHGPSERLEALAGLHKTLFTQKDTIKDQASLEKFESSFGEAAESVLQCLLKVREMRTLLTLAEWLTPALTLGRAFALAWDAAKEREGLIDFDDQIRRAAELLGDAEAADWIRYKLDRRFDHILVDEAQDTNAAQWNIIDALIGDFFTGEGAQGDKLRTIFVVGDYKQAIFRFQGTSPRNFEAARKRVKEAMLGAARNAQELRGNYPARMLQELGLDQSYRTAQSILDFVNNAISEIGPHSFGLDHVPERHIGQERPGHVAFWCPVGYREGEEEEPEDEPEEGAANWFSKPERQLADNIARQVKQWLGQGYWLHKEKRRATAGDVMVLVRKRRELAGLIVARLYAAGVPVAGVDRLRLGAPLAVRDLMAALRFAAQPLDDLNLASLLVSPLIGWSQEQLLEHGYRENGVRLWDHLRRASHPDVAAAMELLLGLLARADYEPPQALLHWLLTGPWQGRRKLVARLGREANDPIDELINAAHAFAATGTPSILGFLRWFDAGEGELKREAGRSDGLVRVMTVHGSKGLQAPIVILADAAGNPKSGRGSALELGDPRDDKRRIPLPPLRKEERLGRLRAEAEQAEIEEMQEHWRLLYVAMTRAEEALFITGSLGAREKAPAVDSWYARLEGLIEPERRLEDPLWGYRLEHGDTPEHAPEGQAVGTPAELPLLPAWLTAPAGAEPSPPRPLAPSSLGEELSADPPFPPGAGVEAARRGVLVHRLIERLPEMLAEARETAARRWLERNAANMGEAVRAEIAAAALRVLADPAWQDIFGPGSLAEVPIAALVGKRVVAGTIDRLLIEPQRIRIVDFKTARRPPSRIDEVPVSVLRQMAAYAAALEAAYPGRMVEAAILYTQAPALIAIPATVLGAQKQELVAVQESF